MRISRRRPLALSLSTLEFNPMRMTTWTKLTATLMSVLVIAATALAAEASMDHLVISVNPKILRPTTQPNLFGALTLKAIDAHGAEQSVPISEAAITVKTKVASGGVTVAVLKNGKIIPKEGGVATVEAVVRRDGREFKSRMFCHNLDLETTTQTFMLRARPSPLCDSASVKRSSPWSRLLDSLLGYATCRHM
jgi:hypothetical protein